jgi:AcrR family transcriptional regulator
MGLKERRDREKSEVRTKVMSAARELFANEGVEAVSMRKIAEAVEYSPTVIYAHFTDKEALLREICNEDFAALAHVFHEIAAIHDPIERIRHIGRRYIQFGLKYPNHYRLMFMTKHLTGPKDEEDCGKGNPDEDAYALVRQTVAEAIAAGRLPPESTDVDLISQVLWAAVHGVVSLEIVKGADAWTEWRPIELRIEKALDWCNCALLHCPTTGGKP